MDFYFHSLYTRNSVQLEHIIVIVIIIIIIIIIITIAENLVLIDFWSSERRSLYTDLTFLSFTSQRFVMIP
jgi:hypothetical protein